MASFQQEKNMFTIRQYSWKCYVTVNVGRNSKWNIDSNLHLKSLRYSHPSSGLLRTKLFFIPSTFFPLIVSLSTTMQTHRLTLFVMPFHNRVLFHFPLCWVITCDLRCLMSLTSWLWLSTGQITAMNIYPNRTEVSIIKLGLSIFMRTGSRLDAKTYAQICPPALQSKSFHRSLWHHVTNGVGSLEWKLWCQSCVDCINVTDWELMMKVLSRS